MLSATFNCEMSESLASSLVLFEALTSLVERYSGIPDAGVPATRPVPRREVMVEVVGEVEDFMLLEARIAWSPGLE